MSKHKHDLQLSVEIIFSERWPIRVDLCSEDDFYLSIREAKALRDGLKKAIRKMETITVGEMVEKAIARDLA